MVRRRPTDKTMRHRMERNLRSRFDAATASIAFVSTGSRHSANPAPRSSASWPLPRPSEASPQEYQRATRWRHRGVLLRAPRNARATTRVGSGAHGAWRRRAGVPHHNRGVAAEMARTRAPGGRSPRHLRLGCRPHSIRSILHRAARSDTNHAEIHQPRLPTNISALRRAGRQPAALIA